MDNYKQSISYQSTLKNSAVAKYLLCAYLYKMIYNSGVYTSDIPFTVFCLCVVYVLLISNNSVLFYQVDIDLM